MPLPARSILHSEKQKQYDTVTDGINNAQLATESIWGITTTKNTVQSATVQVGYRHKRINKAPSPLSSIRHGQQHDLNDSIPNRSIRHSVQEDQYGTFKNSFCKNRMPLLTYCMEQSPSWEANPFSASQEIPRIIWNPKVYYAFTSPVPILSQLDPIHTPTSHLLTIHLNIILPPMPGSSK